VNGVLAVLAGVVPSLGLGLLFWYAMRAIVRADRTERAAEARLDAEADAAQHAANPPS
jgi:hypothetical protein